MNNLNNTGMTSDGEALSIGKKLEATYIENLHYVSSLYMPPSNTIAYKLLVILADGLPHEKTELILMLEDDPRSPLQALRGELYGHWLIHNLGAKKGIYLLDGRHLSGDRERDLEARIQSEFTFRERSFNQAVSEGNRIRIASILKDEVLARYQITFDFYNKKSPTIQNKEENQG